ncbi:TPA: hypothetical protein HA265_06695, partial [Candidatus Woesearchaeota archaeon]|nr:hypothetical protein [Candidatus Woesearchaeota archaeon]
EQTVKQEIGKLKLELEEKRRVISELIDDMKPLEKDMADKNSLIEELGGRLEEVTQENLELREEMQKREQEAQTWSNKLAQLEKEMGQRENMLLELKKRFRESDAAAQMTTEQVKAAQTELEKKAGELKNAKDGLLSKTEENRILKEKLTEKTALVKHLDEHNAAMEQQLQTEKREAIRLKNKTAALESRLYEVNDKNQTIMYELVRARERVQVLEREIDKETTTLKEKTQTYQTEIESIRQEEEYKKQRIMKLHSKKIAVLNAQLASMKAHLEKQRKIMETKTEQEKRLITEFTNRLQNITKATAEIPDVETLMRETPVPDYAAAMEEEEIEISKPEFYERVTADKIVFEPYEGPEPEEIVPMIEIAAQHGDSKEKIMRSLMNSGYKKENIEKAFSMARM